MKLSRDIEPRNFDFWSGAEERANKLTDEDWDIIEPILDDLYPDGTEDSILNDLFGLTSILLLNGSATKMKKTWT